MGLRVLGCLLLMTCVSRGLANQNCTSIVGCTCENTAVTCRALNSFPDATAFDPSITDFTFLDLVDISVVEDIPYTTAKQLTIRNSKIKEISDGAFSTLNNLVDLDLTSNSLGTLREDMFSGLGSLTVLSVEDNNLTSIDDTIFNHVTSLTELNLAMNFGLELNEQILGKLTQLEHINLERCGLDEVPLAALQSATSLKRVILNENPLQSLSHHAFHGMENLEELNLDSCELAGLDHDAFGGLPKLQRLQLSNNQLEAVTHEILAESKHTLTQLHIEHNHMTTLDQHVLEWSRVTHLSLHNNPWSCDCTTAWMAELHAEFLDNTKCASPEEHAGHPLLNVTSELSCPCGAVECGGTSVVALAIAIPIVIICMALIGYYLYKIWQARRTKEAKRKSVRYSAVYKDTVESAPKGAKGYRGAGSEC